MLCMSLHPGNYLADVIKLLTFHVGSGCKEVEQLAQRFTASKRWDWCQE